jgi:hypothetical protein
MPTDDGWRLYLSCATPNSKHWWIDALDAERPEELPFGDRHLVLAGDDQWAVKDPVIIRDHEVWRMWVCCHPLGEAGQEDRMITRYAISADGLHWSDQGVALRGTPGSWDARGTRITTILNDSPLTVQYDGRASAAENWFERTGLAREQDGQLVPLSNVPIAQIARQRRLAALRQRRCASGRSYSVLFRGCPSRRLTRPDDLHLTLIMVKRSVSVRRKNQGRPLIASPRTIHRASTQGAQYRRCGRREASYAAPA